MAETECLDPQITEAVHKIEAFVAKTTGKTPTAGELSEALTRYFVLKEIMEFIVMSRKENGEQKNSS